MALNADLDELIRLAMAGKVSAANFNRQLVVHRVLVATVGAPVPGQRNEYLTAEVGGYSCLVVFTSVELSRRCDPVPDHLVDAVFGDVLAFMPVGLGIVLNPGGQGFVMEPGMVSEFKARSRSN